MKSIIVTTVLCGLLASPAFGEVTAFIRLLNKVKQSSSALAELTGEKTNIVSKINSEYVAYLKKSNLKIETGTINSLLSDEPIRLIDEYRKMTPKEIAMRLGTLVADSHDGHANANDVFEFTIMSKLVPKDMDVVSSFTDEEIKELKELMDLAIDLQY